MIFFRYLVNWAAHLHQQFPEVLPTVFYRLQLGVDYWASLYPFDPVKKPLLRGSAVSRRLSVCRFHILFTTSIAKVYVIAASGQVSIILIILLFMIIGMRSST